MGFKITKDCINDGADSLKGKEYQEYQGGKHRIRLLDDDSTVYYYLVTDTDYVNDSYEDEEEAFAPLDRFMNSDGVTILQYKDANGVYQTL